MTDKAVGAAGSPTSATAFSSMHDSPPHVAVEPSDVSVAAAAAAQQQAQKTGSRKRVFTFQKRWLHSLPIVERSLPEAEMDGRVLKAVRTAGRASAAAAVTAAAAAGADKHKDVIVCMLCDDPASKRELTKVWSRLNCRRGRIENHLTSKHPEFMRLLKNKREVEGDLAVQIFLQNMREGRCNARTEINNGLYSQLQTVGGVMRAGAVDGAPPEDHAELQKRALSDYINVRGDTDSNRKRPKLEGSPANGKDVSMASVYSAGDGLASSVLYQDASMTTQWQSVFYNKLVVVTGGENKAIASIATQLWLLGANVLLTFSNMSALDDFNTKHIGRFPDPSDGEDAPRGVMLPVLGLFRTHADIAEWCSSIESKYHRVDFLINYAGSEVVEALLRQPEASSVDPTKGEPIVSSAALIEATCDSMSSTCFPDVAADEGGWLTPSNGIIVTVASASDDVAVEPVVKALAAKLQPRNVQLNCVLLPSRPPADTPGNDSADDAATLSHSILFLLSPSSRLLSGSILRLQQDKTSAVATVPDRREAEPPEATDVINSHSI